MFLHVGILNTFKTQNTERPFDEAKAGRNNDNNSNPIYPLNGNGQDSMQQE
jgi:hypothetical protein